MSRPLYTDLCNFFASLNCRGNNIAEGGEIDPQSRRGLSRVVNPLGALVPRLPQGNWPRSQATARKFKWCSPWSTSGAPQKSTDVGLNVVATADGKHSRQRQRLRIRSFLSVAFGRIHFEPGNEPEVYTSPDTEARSEGGAGADATQPVVYNLGHLRNSRRQHSASAVSQMMNMVDARLAKTASPSEMVN
jgi:hypothetical protein